MLYSRKRHFCWQKLYYILIIGGYIIFTPTVHRKKFNFRDIKVLWSVRPWVIVIKLVWVYLYLYLKSVLLFSILKMYMYLTVIYSSIVCISYCKGMHTKRNISIRECINVFQTITYFLNLIFSIAIQYITHILFQTSCRSLFFSCAFWNMLYECLIKYKSSLYKIW